MDHDRCSQLLRPYRRGELSAEERREVGSHLETCADCRRENAAVEALMVGEADQMDARERRRLHAAVAAAISSDSPKTVQPARRSWMQRFAPSMGAAALLLVAVVVALSGGTIGGDDQGTLTPSAENNREGADGSGARDGGGAQEERVTEDEPKAPGKPAPQDATESDFELNGGERGLAPKPVFRTRVVDNLEDLAQTKVLERFASSYTADDAARRSDRFLEELSAKAPGAARRQVESCGRLVSKTKHSSLPAAGALGRIHDRPSLVLGFVYSDEERGPLSSYMVWAWPRGSCSSRLDYTTGSLED